MLGETCEAPRDSVFKISVLLFLPFQIIIVTFFELFFCFHVSNKIKQQWTTATKAKRLSGPTSCINELPKANGILKSILFLNGYY